MATLNPASRSLFWRVSCALLVVATAGCTDVHLSVFDSGPGATDGNVGGTGHGGSSAAGASHKDGGSHSNPELETLVHTIDNFEDGDMEAKSPGGSWYIFNDDTGTQRLRHSDTSRRDGSELCLRTTGSDFTDWRAALGIHVGDFFAEGEFNVLRFAARSGDEPREVSLHMIDGSGQHFTRTFQVTTRWEDYSVRLDEEFLVMREEVVRLDISTLHELHWYFFVPESFDFRLDDVQFSKTE